MQKALYLLIILCEGIVLYLINIFKITIPCLFKLVFKFPCPACGLTRAFYSIFNLDILSAINYNILSIPLFLLLCIINIFLIIDIIKNTDLTKKIIFKILKKYKLVFLLLIISEIVNIYHHV